MTNLVTVTKEGRLILKIGGISCGVILIIYMIVTGGSLLRDLFFPKPPPTPLQALGKLPHIKFPQQQEPSGLGIEYRVNTIDGQLSNLPDRVNVYKLIVPEPSLLALNTAKNTIDSQNFVEGQTKITEILYRWTQARTGIVIEYDIVTKNFTISSDFMANPFLISNTLMPDEETIKSSIISYLKSLGAFTDNLDEEKTVIEYLEMNNGLLTAAENLGNARLARVTFKQIPIEEVPVIYGGVNNSVMSFIVSYPDSSFQILEGSFYNYVIDENQKSDYPIKTVEQAFEDLKKGRAYIINPQNLTNVDITDVAIRYYLDNNSTEYLLPIVIFTGINFTAYVEAIPTTSLAN